MMFFIGGVLLGWGLYTAPFMKGTKSNVVAVLSPFVAAIGLLLIILATGVFD
ncbi:hypothetical protein LCGC14_2649530 [marine sediment metagenome]|uniref:Uncharacterized protein n=1 Tax=marine sediment metagenome TaxID=412755 RepID=A0A0F8ZV69_9ZZZZ